MYGANILSSGLPKGLESLLQLCSSVACSTLSLGWSTPLLLLFLVIIQWYWNLQYTEVCNCKYASAIASHRLSSWCQVSSPLHDPFTLGLSITTEAALSPVAFHQLSHCQVTAVLHDRFMPSKPIPPGWLSHINKYNYCSRYNLGYLWNTFSLCSHKTLPRSFTSVITTNFLVPAKQHQLYH